MAKEYKTITVEDTYKGREELAAQVDELASEGWELKSKETSAQGWDFGKTACLGCLFWPLALLGRKPNVVEVVMEREKK